MGGQVGHDWDACEVRIGDEIEAKVGFNVLAAPECTAIHRTHLQSAIRLLVRGPALQTSGPIGV
jgi:hypothetical protein